MKKPIFLKPLILLISFCLALIIGFEGFHYVKANGFLAPGPISATHPKNEPLNGYVSHAEFENECSHCHAPIHCVTDTRCQDCHLEIASQRSEVRGLHGKLPGTDRCQNCHTEHKGRDVIISEFAYSGVDHYALTGFSLNHHKVDFENQPMNCGSCHSRDRYADETLDCLTCHVQADHDDMAQRIELYGTDCVSCHDGVDRTDNFNHDDYYVLEGQHAEVDCKDCHQEFVFMGMSQDCVACHADPEVHVGQFGLECQRCHTAVAWLPAQLTQHTFMLDHGDNPVDNCQACHTTVMTSHDCVSCHDHTAAQMDAYHLDCAVQDYETKTCAECHPTGTSTDIAQKTCTSDVSAVSEDNNK